MSRLVHIKMVRLTVTHKGELILTTRLLPLISIVLVLSASSTFAAENDSTIKAIPVTTTTKSPVVDYQQDINTLQILVQTVQEQRNAILDQLTLAQVALKQQLAKEQTAKK